MILTNRLNVIYLSEYLSIYGIIIYDNNKKKKTTLIISYGKTSFL